MPWRWYDQGKISWTGAYRGQYQPVPGSRTIVATVGQPCVFRSRDGGDTWEDISSNLPRLGRGGLILHPHTGELLHGSVFGTWVFPPPYESPKALYHKLVVPTE